MKALNYKLKFLLLLMAVSVCFSCKKEHAAVKPQPSPFSATVESGATTIPATGGTFNILINAGENGWWVTTAQTSWLTITRMYGSGNFKLPVTVKANTSGVARVITIQINPTFNLPPVSLRVDQDK